MGANEKGEQTLAEKLTAKHTTFFPNPYKRPVQRDPWLEEDKPQS